VGEWSGYIIIIPRYQSFCRFLPKAEEFSCASCEMEYFQRLALWFTRQSAYLNLMHLHFICIFGGPLELSSLDLWPGLPCTRFMIHKL
jgi:hypothetical protein